MRKTICAVTRDIIIVCLWLGLAARSVMAQGTGGTLKGVDVAKLATREIKTLDDLERIAEVYIDWAKAPTRNIQDSGTYDQVRLFPEWSQLATIYYRETSPKSILDQFENFTPRQLASLPYMNDLKAMHGYKPAFFMPTRLDDAASDYYIERLYKAILDNTSSNRRDFIIGEIGKVFGYSSSEAPDYLDFKLRVELMLLRVEN